MNFEERLTPVEIYVARRRKIGWLIVLLVVVLLGLLIYRRYLAETPVDYADKNEQFKYGSIGADSAGGIPYWVWQILPEMFPQYLPDPAAFKALPPAQRTGIHGYQQFGFLVEAGKDLPIGFSQRRINVDRVGLNCAVCHVSTVRVSAGMQPNQIYGTEPAYLSAAKDRVLILGMPGNTVDLQGYFEFLFNCALDARFTADNVMSYVEAKGHLGPIDKYIYRLAVPRIRETLLTRHQQLGFLAQIPRFGPGRVDTFDPYKTIQFGFPYDGSIGTADFPSLWNQRPRIGMQLHWDGNNKSVFERNISASIGAGATPLSLDMERMLWVATWIGAPDPRHQPDTEASAQQIAAERANPVPAAGELKIPAYPFAIDAQKADQGKVVYQKYCAGCHDWQGDKIGQVVPIAEIGTDPHRLDSFTEDLAVNQNTLGAGQWWRLKSFRKTQGYANMPLDGVWARAPYLHNGSVPTLRDLLNPPNARPQTFYRGDDEYDPQNGGFRHDRAVSADGRKLFAFDTTLPGNGNGGHVYGTTLADADKMALIEYMKTIGGSMIADR